MSWGSGWEVEPLRHMGVEEASTSQQGHLNGGNHIAGAAAQDWPPRETAGLFGPPPAPARNWLLASSIDLYLLALDASPIIVKAVTAMLITVVSDLIAQRVSTPRLRVSWSRTLCMALWGLAYTGPVNHIWQELLEQIFPVGGGGSDAVRALKKVALDQLSVGPITNGLLLLYFALVVERRRLRAAMTRVGQSCLTTQKHAWRIWPLVQLVNQEYMPLRFRVLFLNTASLIWTVFIVMQAASSPQAAKGGSAGSVGGAGHQRPLPVFRVARHRRRAESLGSFGSAGSLLA